MWICLFIFYCAFRRTVRCHPCNNNNQFNTKRNCFRFNIFVFVLIFFFHFTIKYFVCRSHVHLEYISQKFAFNRMTNKHSRNKAYRTNGFEISYELVSFCNVLYIHFKRTLFFHFLFYGCQSVDLRSA